MPVKISNKISVIVAMDEDIDDTKWIAAASENELFNFLADNDIYSLDDGEPLIDKI